MLDRPPDRFESVLGIVYPVHYHPLMSDDFIHECVLKIPMSKHRRTPEPVSRQARAVRKPWLSREEEACLLKASTILLREHPQLDYGLHILLLPASDAIFIFFLR